MPEVQEVFRMATQKVRPDPDALERQFGSQRRQSVRRRVIAYAAVGVAAVAASVFGVQLARQAQEKEAGSQPTAPSEGAVSVSDWVRFESPLYGYSMSHPPNWTVVPGTKIWEGPGTEGSTTDPEQADLLSGAGGQVGIQSQAIPDGMTEDEWLDATERWRRGAVTESCARVDEIERIVVDGAAGLYKPDCRPGVIVVVTQGGRGYSLGFVLNVDPATRLPLTTGERRALVEAFLSTLDLQPERATDVG